MGFAKQFQSRFEAGDRNRGNAYFREGRVEIVDVADDFVTTEVGGSYDDYEVTIALDDSTESAISCDCPRFADGYNCKHIWASLCAIDEIGELGANINPPRAMSGRLQSSGKSSATQWRTFFSEARRPQTQNLSQTSHHSLDRTYGTVSLWPFIDVSENIEDDDLRISFFSRRRLNDDRWTGVELFELNQSNIASLDDPDLRRILKRLLDSTVDEYRYYRKQEDSYAVQSHLEDELFSVLQKTGRFFWCIDAGLAADAIDALEDPHDQLKASKGDSRSTIARDLNPITWEGSRDCEITAELVDGSRGATNLVLQIREGKKTYPHTEVVLVKENGLVLLKSRLLRVGNPEAAGCLNAAQRIGGVIIPRKDRPEFLRQMISSDSFPDLKIPASWNYQDVSPDCRGKVKVSAATADTVYKARDKFVCEFFFAYDEHTEFDLNSNCLSSVDEKQSKIVRRNIGAERELIADLQDIPLTSQRQYGRGDLYLVHAKHVESMLLKLAACGWIVEFEGKKFRRAGEFNISVTSGQDWFDLSASVDYEGESIALPALLAAARSKEKFVTLSDGSTGRIPVELLKELMRLDDVGEVDGDTVRFRPSQAMLLDAMLSARENVTFDRGFKAIRKKLHSFDGIKPKNAPRGFGGELREYQREGLGWLHFLREFNFGGCLADDMGLGKTVQVLALLESRRTRRVSGDADRKPSIVVVPKSLIFNWLDEAEKFAPKLRFLNYTGTDRKDRFAETSRYDVLLTTYGTMRKDIEGLSKTEFDYAILDESQAIKNANSLSAKATRLLTADHRLAMTGTPIENHAGELWSLFEFLNPGMLGSSRGFASNRKDEDRDSFVQTLSRGLRPFILRRTKAQVLKDLPEKTEQTLICDMTPAQKKQYNEVRDYYRIKLSKKIETDGLKNSKIHVLEALLRLRQVACDPRLLDAKRKPGIKIATLLEQLEEVLAEGHKALIFSQFTSLLAILKKELDKKSVRYEYLDGKTTRRKEKVQKFQDHENIRLFLISLKAGGSGLNLTAADYVFILDPWWNPAVEAQAIDRAHRIGQHRSVNAYRLICRDTVEEKIVKLQESKRELADSIISADGSLIQSLTADDLQTLLG